MSQHAQDLSDEHAEGTYDEQTARGRSILGNMANLYRLHFGRTPRDVRTCFPADDLVLVVLEESMTPAERRSVELGGTQAVREARLATQQGSADQFRNIVAAAVGRDVVAFTSAHDVVADVATEVFVLAPG